MHSCCTAVLIKTCSPHNVSTPAPNTTRSLSHKHTHVKELQKNPSFFIKYDSHIGNSINKEEETEKILLNRGGRLKEEAITAT